MIIRTLTLAASTNAGRFGVDLYAFRLARLTADLTGLLHRTSPSKPNFQSHLKAGPLGHLMGADRSSIQIQFACSVNSRTFCCLRDLLDFWGRVSGDDGTAIKVTTAVEVGVPVSETPEIVDHR